MAKKPSLGRQKIKIAKIEMKTHLQVTFSKRRSGLFKKASELCTLCGVELAIIVFSPAGKVFSFGHPNVESIIDRFLTRNPPPRGPFDVQKLLSNSRTLVQADHSNGSACELNLQLTHTLNELEIEKKRGEKLNVMRESNENQYWWKAPITQLGLHELEQLRDAMEVLKKSVIDQSSRLVGDATNCFSLVAANASGVGGFDRYEHKPSQIMVASVASRVQKFGYAQGLF